MTNFYKQNVYDPSDDKIGDVDDVLIDKEGRVTAMIIGVGGFLVLNTNKEALKTVPEFTYDKTKTTWEQQRPFRPCREIRRPQSQQRH